MKRINQKLSSLLVCRICLGTDLKLLPIGKYSLAQSYEHVTGLTVSNDDNLPHYMCVECAHRLTNCRKFKSKCLKARSLLLDLQSKTSTINLDSIKSTRHSNDLSSSLSPSTLLGPYEITSLEHDKKVQSSKGIDTGKTNLESDNSLKLAEEYPIKEEFLDGECKAINDDKDGDDDEDFNDQEVDEYESDCDEKEFENDRPIDDVSRLKPQNKEVKNNKEPRLKKTVRRKKEPKVSSKQRKVIIDPKLFTITTLTLEEQIEALKKKQESDNFRNSMFKCTKCYTGFISEETYNKHMTRHSELRGDLECQVCKARFKDRHVWHNHMKYHDHRYQCNQCSFLTTSKQTAFNHMRWHAGHKYQCPHCPKTYNRSTTYFSHLRVKHPTDFICELCGYSYVSKKGIDLHKKLTHSMDNKEVPEDGPLCELCNVRFVSEEAYKTHLAASSKHSHTKTVNCKQTIVPKYLIKKKYEKKKNEQRKELIPCEQCGVGLQAGREYDRHFRSVHPDKNRTQYQSAKCMCEVCGRVFKTYAVLKAHALRHTNTRPFACLVCGKAFFSKALLDRHSGVHTTGYACALCGKTYATQHNLDRHKLVTHEGHRPYKCEMCGQTFSERCQKRVHIGYVHQNVPWPKRSRNKKTDKKGPFVSSMDDTI